MVEWKKLGEVCSEIIVPMRDRPKVFDGSIPWCRIEDIEGMYFNKSLSGLMVSESVIKAMNLKVYPTGTVICSCSATLGVCAINTQPLITNQTFIGLVCSEHIINRFLYYYMTTRKRELLSLSTTGTIPYVSREKFENLVIPIPSLAEQTRIVGILDTFTASIDNLKEQIAQRRKQYEYYRDELLDLEGKLGVEKKRIGDICYISDYVSNGSFASLRENVQYKSEPDYAILVRVADYSSGFDSSKFVYIDEHAYNFLAKSSLDGGEIIMSNVGSCGLLFRCPKLDRKMSLAPNAILIKSNYLDYLYYWLGSNYGQDEIKKITSKSAMPKFNKTEFKKISIPLPPLSEQQRIVSILDTFEASIQNLEAQLKQREKQYEYYRNKLLTFE